MQFVHGAGLPQVFGYFVNFVTGIRMLPDPLPHPSDAVTLNMKGFSQLDNVSCGVVAGWCVVHSFDPRRSFDKFLDLCEVSSKIGVTMASLTRALRGSGVDVDYRRSVTWDRLREWVDSGYPIICNVQQDPDDNSRHWFVIYGYRGHHSRTREVLVAGNGWLSVLGFSVEGRHRLPWGEFERMFCSHALVCRRAGKLAGLKVRRGSRRRSRR